MLALTSSGTGELAAQAAGAIGGRVVDAETLAPLEGARVTLDPAEARAGLAPWPEGSGWPRRTAVTDSSGAYRFSGLPAAQYRVRVERFGYLSRSLEVELRRSGSVAVSVGLEVQPIRLPEVEVTGAVPPPFQRARSPEADIVGARADVARMRQLAYLSADSRELTYGEVIEAVTLGEPDLFRALQRVPGVATRDDYTATIWTRGATWDQTRIYFDGLELYNPTHAGWLFSAVNPDALGSVVFLPGYRSSRWGEGTAAILDLRSRSGTPGETIRGTAEISAASARLALDGAAAGGQLHWMVAGRRTYVDLLTGLLGTLTGDRDLVVPYDFSDLIFRVDGSAGDGWGFSVSSILERDHLRGDIPGIVRGNQGRWGNRAGRVTLKTPLRALGLPPLQARVTTGQTLFGTRLEADSIELGADRSARLPALSNDVQHQVFGIQVQPEGRDSLRWAVGYQVIRDAIRYDGPLSLLEVLAAGDSIEPDPLSLRDVQVYSAAWAEHRWRLADRVDLEAGVRAEFGDSVTNGGRLRVAPRAVVRARVAPGTTVSGAWSRAFQYTQDISPAAGPVGPQLHLSAIWLLATTSPFRPAARADVATLGLERWIGNEWLATLNGYRREARGLLIPYPDSGNVLTGRPVEAVADNSASGMEVSLRRLVGRWTGSIGYSYGSSRMASEVVRAAGDTVRYEFPAPADVPHALDVTGMVSFGDGFRFGGAFTFGSGVPFTRLVLPDTTLPRAERDTSRIEAPYAERTGSYASLDLMLEYSRKVGSWQVSAYGQLRNALGRENAVTYLGSRDCGAGGFLTSVETAGVDCRGADPGARVKDNFQGGLPMLPLLGIRVAF